MKMNRPRQLLALAEEKKKKKLVNTIHTLLGSNKENRQLILKEVDRQLGAAAHFLRKNAMLSQEEFADLLKIHQTAVCRIEKGNQSLDLSGLVILRLLSGIPIDALLCMAFDEIHKNSKVAVRKQLKNVA